MIRNVLVGLDGGPMAERSLAWLKSLVPDARLTLLRAFVPALGGSDPWMDDPGLISQMTTLATKRIESYFKRVASGLKDLPRIITRLGSEAGALLKRGGRATIRSGPGGFFCKTSR